MVITNRKTGILSRKFFCVIVQDFIAFHQLQSCSTSFPHKFTNIIKKMSPFELVELNNVLSTTFFISYAVFTSKFIGIC